MSLVLIGLVSERRIPMIPMRKGMEKVTSRRRALRKRAMMIRKKRIRTSLMTARKR